MTAARPVLPLPCVMLVTDAQAGGERRIEEVVAAAVEGGVNMVQVRDKTVSGGELHARVTRIASAVCRRALIFVNERVDVALAASADGVQLGELALRTDVARSLAPGLLLGRSVHDSTAAAEAASQGADVLVVGTMFASPSHAGMAPAGPPLIRKISTVTSLPLIGIGGITARNAGQVIAAGASGVAVISEILSALDPREAAGKLAAAVHAAWPTAPLHKRLQGGAR